MRDPMLVTFTPPGAASRVTVRDFTGHGAGVYLLFATSAFQVPRELSAAKAETVVVIAKANNATLKIFRISILLFELKSPLLAMGSGLEGFSAGLGKHATAGQTNDPATRTETITRQHRSNRVLLQLQEPA